MTRGSARGFTTGGVDVTDGTRPGLPRIKGF